MGNSQQTLTCDSCEKFMASIGVFRESWQENVVPLKSNLEIISQPRMSESADEFLIIDTLPEKIEVDSEDSNSNSETITTVGAQEIPSVVILREPTGQNMDANHSIQQVDTNPLVIEQPNWRKDYFGTWKLTKQEGFKDIIIFQGINFLTANLAVARGNTLVIGPCSEPPENSIMFQSIGAPESKLAQLSPGLTVTREHNGRNVRDLFAWDEDRHKFTLRRLDPQNGSGGGFMIDVERWVSSADTLESTISVTRIADGKLKVARFFHKKLV